MILLLSLAMLKMPPQVCAETSIPKPAVPEFTVTLIDSSYDVPASSSIDPYTGQTVTRPASHVESRTIEISIKNQPFTPYGTINFFYNIRFKGHFSEDWSELFRVSDGYPTQDLESEYTVLSFVGEYSSTEGMEFRTSAVLTNFPPGAQVDFQVKAMIGSVNRDPLGGWIFSGEESGWSNTQTITIGEGQTPTPSPETTPTITPYQEPQQTEQEIIIGAAIAAAIIGAGIGLLIYLIKRK
jgi:hypothetical protein